MLEGPRKEARTSEIAWKGSNIVKHVKDTFINLLGLLMSSRELEANLKPLSTSTSL